MELLREGFGSAKAIDPTLTAEADRSASDVSSRELSSPTSAVSSHESPALIHTPFGTYDAESIDKRIGIEMFGSCPMEIYFATHAPGEWMRDAQSRSEFERIYGAEALNILDCHGTVPQNIDPVWVTNPAVVTTDGRA